DSRLFNFFNAYPVFPTTTFLTNALAFIPMWCLLYIAQRAPLHSNCRYILCVWTFSLGGVYSFNIAIALLDFYNSSGYMPLDVHDPSESSIFCRIGCVALGVVEIFVLATGGVAVRVCCIRYKRMLGKSSLTVNEAHEMSKAMIPAYAVSFLLK
ncbi:hypothetical protein PMAYCL1PPCAC_16414, partial [Pristionchus mayeri]